jgi:hypothetical protein
MNRNSLDFLQTVRTQLYELEQMNSAHYEFFDRRARAEKALAAARRALSTIENFVRSTPGNGAESQRC